MKTIVALAVITFKEAFRSRFIGFLMIFALLIMASSTVFSYFSIQEQMKLIKDIGLAGITIFGLLISLVLAAFIVPMEEEQKTIYNIRTNRISPFSYVFGRFAGISLFLFVILLALTLVFFANIALKLYLGELETAVPSRYGALSGIPGSPVTRFLESLVIVKAIFMIYMKLLMLTSITLLISMVASVTLNFALSLIIFIGGHLTYVLMEVSHNFGLIPRLVMQTVYFLFPNFEHLNIADSIVVGRNITWTYIGMATGYSIFYIFAVLVLAALSFDRKEV